MADLQGFDASQVEPKVGFEPIPPGKYLAVMTHSEMKDNKAGTGQFLEITFTILEGVNKGHNLKARLNLSNPNPKAVEMARGELSAICWAVGVLAPKDSVELHNLPLMITVQCRKRQGSDEMNNEISAYAKRDAAPANSPGASAQSPPPWKRP